MNDVPGTDRPAPSVVTDRSWPSFLAKARSSVDFSEAGSVLCLDPGETTGWAYFHNGILIRCGQEGTGSHPAYMADFLYTFKPQPETIVYEEYRIRGNKAKQHIGSEVFTIQHIGVIRAVADDLGANIVKQSAGMAKTFATDVKLRRWGLYQPNKRHANDAIRHGVYFHLFFYGRKDHKHGQDEEEVDADAS